MSSGKISEVKYAFSATWKQTLIQTKFWEKFRYNLTRFTYTATHNCNFSLLRFLKMRFLLLKAEWGQYFNFCSESHGAGGWMCLPLRQTPLSCPPSWAVPFLFINLLFLSPPQNDSHLSWQGIHKIPNTLSQDICCVKCVLSLMNRINTK